MFIQLEDKTNFGVMLRDGINENLDAFKVRGVVHLSLLRKAIERIDIPEQYWGDVLRMTDYRKYDRIKDSVEQLIESVVLKGILNKILEEEKQIK